MDTTKHEQCIFVNTAGIRCPEMYENNTHRVCWRHSCIKCGKITIIPSFCNEHSETINEQLKQTKEEISTDPCKYPGCKNASTMGTTNSSVYCVEHRCKHGDKSYRGDYWCNEMCMIGGKYCGEHMHSCECYISEYYPMCGEDDHQCDVKCVVYEPKGMCKCHYDWYIFSLAPEYK